MRNAALRALPIVGVALPPVLVGWTIAREAVDVPFWDDWELVALLERLRTGSLGLGDLWAQHNEHRLVLPNLLMLGLARVSAWDTRVTMATSLIVSLAALVMVWLMIRATVARSAPALSPWVVVGASLLTFSMVAWQNWLWAWQVQVFMCALAACVVAWALGRYGSHGPGMLLAVLAAIAGALTFANGLALLAVVPAVLAIDPRDERRPWRRPPVIVMAGVGALVITIYVVGYQPPANHPSPFIVVTHPLEFVRFVLAYLGSPLALGWQVFSPNDPAPVVVASIVYGLIGVAIVTASGLWLWRGDERDRVSLVPWIALALFGLLSAAMTAGGRLGIGLEAALASRYTTVSALFWIAVIAIAALAVTHGVQTRATARQFAAFLVIGVIAEILVLIGYATSWMYGLAQADVHHEHLRRGRECLAFYRTAPPECLTLLYPDVDGLRHRAMRLETLALGPFAPSHRERPLRAYTVTNMPADRVGGIDFVGPDETKIEFIVVGWGINPETRHAADTVLLAVDGEVIGRAETGLQRPDLATAAPATPLASAGWTFRFSVFRLQPGPHTIEAYAVLDANRVVKLLGARTIAMKSPT